MRWLKSRIADAVEVQDEAVRHVVVEGRVEAGAGGVRPLPGEAVFRGCISDFSGEDAAVRNRCAPCRAVPGFEGIAGAGVGVLADGDAGGGGEGVASGGEGVYAFRRVAIDAAHGRGYDDIRDGQRRAEESRLVDGAVLRQFRVREDAIIDTHGLDRAEEPALVARGERSARAADAQRVCRDVADGMGYGYGVGNVRRLENVVLVPVADGRRVASFPGVLVRVVGKVHVSAVRVLEGEATARIAVHVVVDVELVVVAGSYEVWPENVRVGRGLQFQQRIGRRVADDLDGNGVGKPGERIDELGKRPSAEPVAVVQPRAGVGLVVLEARDVALHEVDPLRRSPAVRLVRADVADAVEVQDEAVRHVVVEERVEGDGHLGMCALPLPGEAHLR